MIKVGITGGIGSGKTTVCEIFKSLGIPIYNADDRAKQLMLKEPIKSQLIALFGEDVYAKNGTLNRPFLANKVFQDKFALEELNAIVHPVTIHDGKSWFVEQEKMGFPYAIKEAALLFESNSNQLVDYVIVVTAPLELRIQRVIDRDTSTRESVISRINNQWSEEKKLALADFVIQNNGTIHLTPQVAEIHNILMSQA
jgi:dephospho-CoA kinase